MLWKFGGVSTQHPLASAPLLTLAGSINAAMAGQCAVVDPLAQQQRGIRASAPLLTPAGSINAAMAAECAVVDPLAQQQRGIRASAALLTPAGSINAAMAGPVRR